MDTKTLAYFRAVFETGSFARAAERSFISPQGLSKAIASLEAELGEELFIRTNRGVAPTPYARALYPKAAKIAALLESVDRDAGSGAMRSLLQVACTSGSLSYLGSSFELDFQSEHPEIDLQPHECTDSRVCERVESGLDEIGLVAGPVDYDKFDARLFASHPHVLLVRDDDPLASKGVASIEDLGSGTLTLMGAGYRPFSYLQDLMARRGVTPSRVVEYAEFSTAMHMVEQDGIRAITTDFAVPRDRGRLVAVPFDDHDLSWNVFFIWPAGTQPTVESQAFIEFSSDWYARNEARLFPWREKEAPTP